MARKKKTEVKVENQNVVQDPTQDPEVMAIIERYKDTAARWNSIAQYLAGKTQIDPKITPEQHVAYLAQAYYWDVYFLLTQLGVVKEQNPEEVTEESK